MMMLRLKVNPSERDRPQLLGALRAQRAQTAGIFGCLEFSILAGVEPPGALVVFQQWEEERYLQRYLRSDSFKRVLEMMELSVATPELHFYEVQACTGLETVANARCDGAIVPGGSGGTLRKNRNKR
jgi:quinol monooxygenase YgiN